MKSEYSGRFIVFETTHFSTYMLTADKLAAGYTGLTIDLNAGDVNGDGDITSADAVLLMKYLAGYNIVLGQ